MASSSEPASWRIRTEAQDAVLDLSLEEKDCLSVLESHYSGNVEKCVEDVMELLRNWPQFFQSRELCGEKVHAAILSAVCQSLILGALFAGVSITPLFSTTLNVTDWKSRTHGASWSLLLMLNIATIGSSALFLTYLTVVLGTRHLKTLHTGRVPQSRRSAIMVNGICSSGGASADQSPPPSTTK